jgi:hypothetical protein
MCMCMPTYDVADRRPRPGRDERRGVWFAGYGDTPEQRLASNRTVCVACATLQSTPPSAARSDPFSCHADAAHAKNAKRAPQANSFV